MVIDIKKPYLLHLFELLESINNIKYIVHEQFGQQQTQYNYDNYKRKTEKKKEEAKAYHKEQAYDEAKMHEGLIDTYKDDHVEGSWLISLLNNPFTGYLDSLFDEDETSIIRENKYFQKSYEKANFTEEELYRGYAQLLYWQYAHKRYDEYKKFVQANNAKAKKYNPNREDYSNYRKYITRITKEQIADKVKVLFNYLLHEDAVKQVRVTKDKPALLKYYDKDIPIFTIKSIEDLEKAFYTLMIDELPTELIELLLQLIGDDEERLYQEFCKIRPYFY